MRPSQHRGTWTVSDNELPNANPDRHRRNVTNPLTPTIQFLIVFPRIFSLGPSFERGSKHSIATHTRSFPRSQKKNPQWRRIGSTFQPSATRRSRSPFMAARRSAFGANASRRN
jgi:hypothetical protein